MKKEDLTKRVYNIEIKVTGVRGRPPVRCLNKVDEYCREKRERVTKSKGAW